ncbi:MAG: hypothetical protein R3E55_05310 [Burkholderiaceae bacterium]|nr:hypothetical protein [Burkholderiaceae bacterium]MCO5111929.1 hypothetical protein [Burkholderiaceae bacterium]
MYGISAVRYDARQGPCISEVLMGLLAADGRCWESAPVPVPLVEVVDRLLEGDPIVAVRAGPRGTLVHGAPACLQVQDSRHGGWDECISFPEDGNAPALHDLPMF